MHLWRCHFSIIAWKEQTLFFCLQILIEFNHSQCKSKRFYLNYIFFHIQLFIIHYQLSVHLAASIKMEVIYHILILHRINQFLLNCYNSFEGFCSSNAHCQYTKPFRQALYLKTTFPASDLLSRYRH